SDTDRTFCCCERFVSCKECEAVCVFFQKHFSKVTMSKTYFSLVSYRSWNTESLKSFSDCCCCVCCSCASFFDCDCSTYNICPACVFKADRLNAFYLIVNIKACVFCNFLCFFDRSDAIAV